jgi:hypothetical protein
MPVESMVVTPSPMEHDQRRTALEGAKQTVLELLGAAHVELTGCPHDESVSISVNVNRHPVTWPGRN